MDVVRIDHVTINTTDLAATVEFYRHFLGLRPGWRPPLGSGGAWLYAEGGRDPIIHLVERDRPAGGGKLDHIAFRHVGLAAYLDKVRSAGVNYIAVPVGGTDLVQIQHRDPNGILIELTFAGEPIAASDVTSLEGRP